MSLSSPYHHQGNGKAESAVKIVKRIFSKADKSGQDRWLALLEWRNTVNHVQSSPAQRLFSRRLRTKVPTKPSKLRPEVQQNVPEKIAEVRKNAKYYHDKRAKPLPELEMGTDVYVQLKPEQNSSWSKGKISDKLSSRKYQIEHGGKNYTRNRQNVKAYPSGVPFFPQMFETTSSQPVPEVVPEPELIPELIPEEQPSTSVLTNATTSSTVLWSGLIKDESFLKTVNVML